MIFENGDCYITYQQQEQMDGDTRADLARAFREHNHSHLMDIITTAHTVTFRYSPIQVMEGTNTIEPGDVVIEEAREFLREMEFSI